MLMQRRITHKDIREIDVIRDERQENPLSELQRKDLKLLITKGAASANEINATTEAWHRAAHATPHGKPIFLENDPERIRRP